MLLTGSKLYTKNVIKILLLFFVSSSVFADEALVGFSEKKTKTRVGEQFTIDIVMSGMPTTEGGGLNLKFNPKMLQVTNVSVDKGTWNFVSKDGEIDNQNGLVTDILFSNYKGVNDSAKIVTIEFEAIKRGRTKLRLNPSSISPFASNGEVVDVKFKKAVVKVRKAKKKAKRGHSAFWRDRRGRKKKEAAHNPIGT